MKSVSNMGQMTSPVKGKNEFQKIRQSSLGHASSRNMKCYVKKAHSL